MSQDHGRANRIHYTMRTEGWPDILAILDEMAKTPQDELYELMVRKPETLTGRIAIAQANRAQGLIEVREDLYALVAPLNPRKGQGG